MKNKIIIFCVFLFFVSAGLFTLWYVYERPNEGINLEYVNVSIIAKLSGENFVTGYSILRDGYAYNSGETLDEGAILVQVPVNSTYTFTSKNLENQTFYTASTQVEIYELKPYRVNLDIIPAGSINISHIAYANKTIVLEVSSLGPYNDMSYCIDWSSNFLWAKSLNDEISNTKYVPKYVKCYDTDTNLNNNKYLVTLQYKNWNVLDSEDFISIYFLDKNIENGTVAYTNVGGKDIEYTVYNI